MALYQRHASGEGQHIDFSMQELATRAANLFLCAWDILKVNQRRGAAIGQTVRTTRIWPCQDGYVIWMYTSGPQSRRVNGPMIEWIDSAGMANDFVREFEWETFDLRKVTQETVDRISEVTNRFFMAHTKAELLDGAVKRRIMLYPVATTKDVVDNVQLKSRQFMQPVAHPELNTTINYPGSFVKASLMPPGIRRRPPLIGEHNQEIYEEDLGISAGEVRALAQRGVI
jgi:crotonobetainyl-CoA:carnitine CoA-transferase CaiB-like acyl-CoA transferase